MGFDYTIYDIKTECHINLYTSFSFFKLLNKIQMSHFKSYLKSIFFLLSDKMIFCIKIFLQSFGVISFFQHSIYAKIFLHFVCIQVFILFVFKSSFCLYSNLHSVCIDSWFANKMQTFSSFCLYWFIICN